ncbi:MAG: MBL fold metallo-hydrolase [Bacteroidales bacterium]
MEKPPPNSLTFLGTGTSTGVPVIACDCPVCMSKDPRDKRLRTSAMLTIDGKNYVFDSGPDFRYQMIREHVRDLEAVIFTHEHRDHIAGLDDIRAFNYLLNKRIHVYAAKRVIEALSHEFQYIFQRTRYFGAPQIDVTTIRNQPFKIADNLWLTPIKVWHHKNMPVFGYRTGTLTYITDAKFINDQELEKAKGTKTLVLNALRKSRHVSHLSIDEALEIVEKIKPQVTYLTHMSHFIGKHEDVEKELPDNVHLAYDGLKITI